MRLERLAIHRFRCFWDQGLDLAAGGTVLVGQNDAGKSTLVEAVRALFVDEDRFGAPYEWADIVSRPVVSDMMARELSPSASEDDEDEDDGNVAWVLGEFGDLSEEERRQWAPVITDGALRCGAVFGPSAKRSGRCLVIDRNSALGMALEPPGDEFDSEPESKDAAIAAAVIDMATILLLDDQVWVQWSLVPFLSRLENADGEALWPEPRPRPEFDFPSARNLVTIPGPEASQPSADELLRQLVVDSAIRELSRSPVSHADPAKSSPPRSSSDASTALAEQLAPLIAAADVARGKVEAAYASALEGYLGAGAHFSRDRLTESLRELGVIPSDLPNVARRVAEAVVGDLAVTVERTLDARAGKAAGTDVLPLSRLGAGARRRAALAVLELYSDLEISPADRPVMVVVEEPESGLDPAAQRHVVKALRKFPAYGVQSVVVSHSPVFINACEPAGLRRVRAELGPIVKGKQWRHHSVDVFERLQEAAHELGALPSDVLLARRFVVVEGDSDVQALSTWARTLGCPLEDRGVQLVSAHGHGSAALVSRFLDLAYEGASMVVILDNGRDTDKTKLEIEARFGDRVRVRLLAQTEIERYYSPRAIVDWLRLCGAAIEASEERSIADRIALDPSKRLLRTLAREYLGRDYDVVVDGRAIVNLMPERDVPDEIKGLIYDLADD